MADGVTEVQEKVYGASARIGWKRNVTKSIQEASVMVRMAGEQWETSYLRLLSLRQQSMDLENMVYRSNELENAFIGITKATRELLRWTLSLDERHDALKTELEPCINNLHEALQKIRDDGDYFNRCITASREALSNTELNIWELENQLANHNPERFAREENMAREKCKRNGKWLDDGLFLAVARNLANKDIPIVGDRVYIASGMDHSGGLAVVDLVWINKEGRAEFETDQISGCRFDWLEIRQKQEELRSIYRGYVAHLL